MICFLNLFFFLQIKKQLSVWCPRSVGCSALSSQNLGLFCSLKKWKVGMVGKTERWKEGSSALATAVNKCSRKSELLELVFFLSSVAGAAVKQNRVKGVNKHAISSLISGIFAIRKACFFCKQNLFQRSYFSRLLCNTAPKIWELAVKSPWRAVKF